MSPHLENPFQTSDSDPSGNWPNQGAIVLICRRVERDTEVLQNVQCRLIFFCRTIVRHVTCVDHDFWARIEGDGVRYYVPYPADAVRCCDG